MRIAVYLGIPLACGMIVYSLIRGNHLVALLNWIMLLTVVVLGVVTKRRADKKFEFRIYAISFRVLAATIGIDLLYEIGFNRVSVELDGAISTLSSSSLSSG